MQPYFDSVAEVGRYATVLRGLCWGGGRHGIYVVAVT
jgi:hypothetical protein